MGVWMAVLSGVIGGGTLLLGAAAAWLIDIPRSVVTAIMAGGAGVLVATLAFELVEESAASGGLVPTALGFLGGAVLYIVADWLVSRPRPDAAPTSANIASRRSASAIGGSGAAIAIGALIDGIPESIVMGLAVVEGGALSVPIVVAVALSNIPEGLASTAELKRSGAGLRPVVLLWSGIVAVTVLAALAGFLLFDNAPPELTAVITTIAAGGLFAMVCNTMIPEAFQKQHALTGLWASLGFLVALALHLLAG